MTQKKTIRLTIASEEQNTPAAQHILAQAAEVLRAGGTVAFPTETVYGLGANALDAQAVEKIFLAKQRPSWDPLIVHVSDIAMLHSIVEYIPTRAQKLIDAFWPGPLTLLLQKKEVIPAAVTAGRALVGVRMPAHPIAHALIAAVKLPIAAPSANRFGHTSPTTAQHVLDDLDSRIDLILDGGPTQCGLESTVLEVTEAATILYRPGAITAEQIESIAGRITLYQPAPDSPPQSLPSPGVGIRHYAPSARVILIEIKLATEAAQHEEWLHAFPAHLAHSKSTGALLPKNWPLPPHFSGVHFDWGAWSNPAELAQRLFAGLRALDDLGAAEILCPLPPATGLGAAIRDRLQKAAREK